MISGMYMGELVRCVLIDLVRTNLLFGGESSPLLETPFEFKTAWVSFIESDTKNSYSQTVRVLEKLGLAKHASQEDYEIMKLVCGRVSTRAAYLVSAAITCILKKMKRSYTTVGVDGSVYRFHPHFHDLMEKKITELLCGTDYKFSLMLSEDGSGRGAGKPSARCLHSINVALRVCLLDRTENSLLLHTKPSERPLIHSHLLSAALVAAVAVRHQRKRMEVIERRRREGSPINFNTEQQMPPNRLM